MKVVFTVSGSIEIRELEAPRLKANYVLVETICSAISPGTEMMLQDMKAAPSTLGYSAMGAQVLGVVVDYG